MRFFVILSVAVLSACTLADAYLMKYDTNEYRLITEIGVDSSIYKTQCDGSTAQTNAQQLAYKTELFEKLTKELPHNQNNYNAAVSLNQIAQGLVDRYKKGPTPALFCRLKMGAIESSSEVIQHVTGDKPR
jgi:hypothetical protein